ncbi:Type 1 phosphatases regulator ypi1 [Coemansia sp. S155-1]|nr:Type 1 phosphatases regulator ypi1 [Coemansia sp. S155-1]
MIERPAGTETTNASGSNAVARSRLGGLRGSGTSLASHGSRTMVVPGNEEGRASPATSVSAEGILRLRGESNRHASASAEEQQPSQAEPVAEGSHVQWAEDTVDNENMNRKKSKVCCIFRRQRQFDESDSDESCGSSNDDDDGDDSPNEYERMPKAHGKKHKHKHQCQAGNTSA